MRGEEPAVRGDLGGERGELVRPGEHPRGVAETRGEPEAARVHRFAHPTPHVGDVRRCRRAVAVAHDGETDRAMSGEVRGVDGKGLARELVEELPVRLPVVLDRRVAQELAPVVEQPGRARGDGRRRETAVAGDDGRHALFDQRRENARMTRLRQYPVRMRVDIDEARRDREPRGVDDRGAFQALAVAATGNGHDPVIDDADGGRIERSARPIGHEPAVQDYLTAHGWAPH